jgi:Ca2+-binding EF-hand superfamily protein
MMTKNELETMFLSLDLDRDGYLTRKDFDEAEVSGVRGVSTMMLEKFSKHLASMEAKGTTNMSFEQFQDACKELGFTH